MKLRKGDQVIVLLGKDKGQKGKIEKIFLKKNKVFIPGVNLYKRHLKPQGEKKPGGIVEIVKPLSISNVAFLCPKCHQPARIGFRFSKSNQKERICKKCQQVI